MIPNELIEKANKCYGCANAKCSEACPLGMPIPKIIKFFKEEKLKEAYLEILNNSYFGSVCGRVCMGEQQCKNSCIRKLKSEAVEFNEIEKYIFNWGIENVEETFVPVTLEKVAIVGGGPAGLTVAIELRKKGYDVTIFEKEKSLGGILRFGIPEYRLPKKELDKVVSNIVKHEIKVETSQTFGKDFTIDDLENQGFKAVFLGLGNYSSKKLKIKGVTLSGVYGANEFLRNIEKINFKNVVIIGGGNVAMDVARMAKLRGAEKVTVAYRKAKDKMKADKAEIESAEKEKINFEFECLPVEFQGDFKVESVKCDNGEEILADTVVMAIGALPNLKHLPTEIEIGENGLVKISENGATSLPHIFAGGDLVEERATVALAIKSAKKSAIGIDKLLRGEKCNENL